MGFLESVGVDGFFGGFNFASLGSWAGLIALSLFILFIGGGVTLLYYSRKAKKISFKFQIPIFMKVNGKYTRIDMDTAREVFVPETNISLIYLLKRKIYIARPTRSMGKNEFWYAIAENGEWVNIDLSQDPEHNNLAIANYDHRDTRYAYVNLKEIIKRNYKDKSIKWWKEYAGVISMIIYGIMLVGAMWFFFWQAGKMISQLAPLADGFRISSENMMQAVKISQNLNSGIIPA